jgi:hypothetical protein
MKSFQLMAKKKHQRGVNENSELFSQNAICKTPKPMKKLK